MWAENSRNLASRSPQGTRKEKRDNWLLIKTKDEFATDEGDILEGAPESIGPALPMTILPREKYQKQSRSQRRPQSRKSPRLCRVSFPRPGNAENHAPEGTGWLHEVKFDGYRLQAHVSAGKVKLFTRSGLDWTKRFGEPLRRELLGLNCKQAIIDGEIVVLSDKGVASFAHLQADLSEGGMDRMIFYAFDLLHLDNAALLEEPLLERKSQLEALLNQKNNKVIRYSEHFEQAGETMLSLACRMGLEGVISKQIDAPYRSGRSLDWIKSGNVPCARSLSSLAISRPPRRDVDCARSLLAIARMTSGSMRAGWNGIFNESGR